MVLVFLGFGFVAARELGVDSVGEFWSVAKERIWVGGDPLPGQTKFTFWHVTFFAWFCNMAMHIGMSDLSVFRFARKSWYGDRLRRRHVRRALHGLDLGGAALLAPAAAGTRPTPTCSPAPSPPAPSG